MVLGLTCLAAMMGAAFAAAELQPGKGIADLGQHLTFHSDPKARLATVLKRFQNGAFKPDLSASMLDSNYAPEAWGGVQIINATVDDGRAPDPFALTIALALSSEVDVYLIREGGLTENLLNYSAFKPFAPEEHSVTRLRTPVFRIAPQESVILLVNFKFGPFQSFHMALETPTELEASAFNASIAYTAFYAFCLSCLVFFFGFHAAMKNWTGFFFAFLFAITLVLIAFIDGLLFRFLYPSHPQWHSIAGFGLMFAISGVGFAASGQSLVKNGEWNPRATWITAMALLSLAGFIVSLFAPGTYVSLSAYVLIVLMAGAAFLASREWTRAEAQMKVFPLLVTGLSIIGVSGVLLFMAFGGSGRILVPDAIKAVFTVLLVSTMTSLTAHIIHIRRQHAKAVKSQLAALEEEAKRSQELLVAEKKYSRARELASLRQKQLATASHDLKQPIASLRMTFDSIADQTEPHLRKRLREAFDYMEALSSDYLKDTMPGVGGADGTEAEEESADEASAILGEGEEEAYALSVILGTVHQMFHEEAISKGLKLRMVPSSVMVQAPPIILMRIVSNLVSNAVKYTLTGCVLIGARRKADHVVLCVADTGPGLDEAEIATFKQAYQKGETSEGHGLGMAVCFELAKQHGLGLEVRSAKGKGTIFTLAIPLAE